MLFPEPEYLLTIFYSNEARMLTKRMPPSLTNAHPVMQNTLKLLRAVWNDNHTAIYQTIRQPEWPEVLKGLVQSYESKFVVCESFGKQFPN